jgi:hypothetical protein
MTDATGNRRRFLESRIIATVDSYEIGDLGLPRLVADVEACIDALLDVAPERWVEELRSAWGRFETVYAIALDEERAVLDADDRETIAVGIAELRSAIGPDALT